MISIAGPVAEVFDYREGNFIADPNSLVERAQLFDNTTQLVITFVKYLLGGLATLMFIRSGAVMVASGDNEEDVTKEKKNLALGAAGLLLVIVSDLVVRRVFYIAEFNEDADKTIVKIDQNEFLTQLVAITNFIVTWVGPIMMLGIVAGGFLYLTAGGDEERTGLAKKIVMNSIIGVIIIYGAFALVSTIIAGQF
jgi:cytochrome bd-type quinol oxidase subunit 2